MSSQLIPSLILSTTLLKLQRNLVLILQLQGFALPCFSGQTFYKLPYYSTKTHNAPKTPETVSLLLKTRLFKFLPDLSRTIVGRCDGKFDLLHFFEICRLVKSFTSRKEASFSPSLLNDTTGKFKLGKK